MVKIHLFTYHIFDTHLVDFIVCDDAILCLSLVRAHTHKSRRNIEVNVYNIEIDIDKRHSARYYIEIDNTTVWEYILYFMIYDIWYARIWISVSLFLHRNQLNRHLTFHHVTSPHVTITRTAYEAFHLIEEMERDRKTEIKRIKARLISFLPINFIKICYT